MNTLILTTTLLTLSAVIASAETQQPLSALRYVAAGSNTPKVVQQSSDSILPLLLNGDGYRTRITCTNLEDCAAEYDLSLINSDGRMLSLNWAGRGALTQLKGTVPANSIVELVTTGMGVEQIGWAGGAMIGGKVAILVRTENREANNQWRQISYGVSLQGTRDHRDFGMTYIDSVTLVDWTR